MSFLHNEAFEQFQFTFALFFFFGIGLHPPKKEKNREIHKNLPRM